MPSIEQAAAIETQRKSDHDELMQQHFRSGFLYKRGKETVIRNWKKRWCVLELGVLHYYTDPKEYQKGKPPLGSLSLANCSVRRPTDAKSKGKYESTCFRLDVDPAVQAQHQHQHQHQHQYHHRRIARTRGL